MIVWESADGSWNSAGLYFPYPVPATGGDFVDLEPVDVPDWSPFFPLSPLDPWEFQDGLVEHTGRVPINKRRLPFGDVGDKRRWNWRLS